MLNPSQVLLVIRSIKESRVSADYNSVVIWRFHIMNVAHLIFDTDLLKLSIKYTIMFDT